MAFNNVPVNGWPQIKDLEKLDALAKQIENMPTLTSSDRDWLDEWEEALPELPADPQTDGTRVLTAITDDGETVKSWETPASGVLDYSETETLTGRKWIDGEDTYLKVITFEQVLTVASNTWTDTGVASGMEHIIDAGAVDTNGVYYSIFAAPNHGGQGNIGVLQTRSTQIGINSIIVEYTKPTTT